MFGATSISINSAPMSSSGSGKLRYEKCLENWGNTSPWCITFEWQGENAVKLDFENYH